MRQKKLAQRAASAALAACMMFTLSAPALAESTNALMQMSINSRSSIARLNEENSIPEDAVTLDIADGDIEVSVNAESVQTAKQGDQTYTGVFVVTGTSTTSKLVIKGSSGTAAKVYLNDLHITVSSGAAVSVSKNVDLYIEGSSVLQSGENCAGIQKEDDGQLTIDGSGSLEATGGQSGAGIGGAFHKSGNNITINGGKIIAQSTTGYGWGAGIGGGNEGDGNNITINGGDVTAIGGSEAAGIGGGIHASAENITINGGTVTAKAGGGAAAIGGGHANPHGGKGTNINLVGGDVTVQSNHGVATIGGVDGEIPIPSTFGGSLTYLDANENKDTTKTNIEKYGPVVNGKAVNSVNYANILGDGALSYDKNTNTLSLNKSYTDADSYVGTLTIYAPNTTVDLNGGEYSVLQGKLVIEAAADVTLTSTEARAVVGDVNITCAGKLSITCENIAVDGNLTVNNASSVELIGKNNNGGTVNGAAVFNNTDEVTIQNKDATKGAAGSISYSGNYVYYTAEGGALTDPRITPITANASYLHIVPSELHSITVPEGCTFKVDGADLPTAHAGQTVTVTAPDKGDHFEFAGWTISPDSVTLTDADKLTATFTMPDGDVKLENSYNQLYDVTVKKGTATPSFAKEGTLVTIIAEFIPGRKFERWDVLGDNVTVTLDNKNSKTTTFNMPAGEVQVEAKYKALQSITVNDGTYTVNGETTTEAVKGDKIVATANPAPEGEKFVGWNVVGVDGLTDEQKAVSPIEFEMPKNGVELTAQYKTLRNIVVNNGTYTVNGTDDKQAVEGDKINIKAAERPGYQFVRWEVVPDNVTITGVNNEEATFTMPNENVELKARYNKLYTITVDGGHADVTSALTGKEITVDADVPDGKKFMGWKADGITLTPAQQQSKHITFFMPEGNVTLKAEYKTLHTVTVIGADGTSTVLPDTYIEGDTVTVNAEKYGIPAGEFDSWESNDIRLTTDKRQSPTLTFKMVDKNVTLIAVPKTLFTITVTGGTVNGQSTTARVKAGDWVTIKAENKGDDWKFIEWKLTGPENFTLDTSQSTVQFQMPSGNVTLEAVQMEYRTVTINNGNSPTTVNDKALHGDSITVTAEEVDGKRFAYWEVTGPDGTKKLTDKKITVTVPEGDITLTAKYNELYTVTVDDEIVGAFIEGEWVPIKANVPADRKFEGWTSPDTLLNELQGNENNAEFKLLMPGHNVTLNATTSQRYYVTVNDEGNELHPSEKTEVAAGDSFYLEAAGRDGWEFIGWTVDNEDVAKQLNLTKAERQSFTMPKDTDVTITANYRRYRTITVNGGTVNDKTTITDALREQNVEIKAVYDPEEQVFDHWEAEGPDGWALTEEQKGAESFTLKVPKGNVTLTAMYKTLHTVTVINGTAQNGETTIKAVAGEKITLTPNLPDDQEFDCWYSEDINLNEEQRKTPELTFKMRDFDITIEAKSKQLYFVELADADTTANGESGKVEVKSGEDVTIVAPEREGWKFIRWEVSDNAHLDNATASEAHFNMPSGNVSVKAVYYEYHTITMTDDKGTAYNEKGEEITRAVQGDVITIKAKKDREDHEFNRWVITPDNGTLVGKNDPEATFTMPDEAVVVDAKYKHLQGITVNGGAAYYMDGTPVETAKAGETIVIVAEDRSKDGLRFAYWEVNSDNVTVEGGEKATFEMAKAPVELTAHYEAQITYSNDPAIFDEGVGLHEDIVWEKVGDTVSITAVLDNSTDEDDIGTFPGMTFDYWEIVTPENLNVTSGLNSETITFEVPECEVKLIAHWKDTTTVTPAEPLDPGFPVEPEAPAADGSGAVIGVAAAGAAIWGGYEITTRVILNDLLPEGAAIPTNRGELAMLIWTQKGKPEPAAEPDFTDVSDTELAKAAQWCVEQGLLTAEDGKFEPDGWTPKWRVIQVWNQAFPKE
ncbi:InlB B-repeat-containing protein [Faecalibacterium langellae]|uniref:Uncharacterized protein n=1 Tax=Faecalibacterium langellae TaxID=3435293 RepID=A0ACC9D074_9FIRM|nr:InlB B-repeat-containing protein [Faecalibacterium prausnitzii]PDX61536.1 hypothetical protein CGS49_05950 [Faecalibacterium prausnitzii]